MQKDVLYIDVEDDITAIIGKVKASKEKIVALVPPKRIGILQSAVNLRLLARAAQSSHKHLVLITNNQALMALSAAAKIPVAKNLQSKPEIAEIPALSSDDGDDIIDGQDVAVGELSKTADTVPASAIKDLSIDDDIPKAAPPVAGAVPAKPRVKSGIKVPSFDQFRKKVFIFSGLGVLLVLFFIWAIFFAPQATVVIDARTTPTDVKTSVAIGPTLDTNAETSTLKSIQVQDKQAQTVDFDATGTQNAGEKATAQVKFTAQSLSPTVVPAGTQLTSSGGLVFTTDNAVTIPASSFGPGCFPTACPGTTTVNVTAIEGGTKYNGADGDLSGAPSGSTAKFNNQSAGGTDKTIKIVLQADVEKAKAQLVALNTDDAKKKLAGKFDSSTLVIDDSFQATPADPQSSPAVGQESKDGRAKLTSEVAYTMNGVAKGNLSTYLKAALDKQLNKDTQRIYSDGVKTAKLSNFKQNNGNTTITLAATGQIGPMINDDDIKEKVKGKRFAEVQEILKQIDGVNDAQTKFSPFWVNTVPNDVKKIKIEFKLQNDS
jgi:hypothetical protein